ncbi:MAG: hypothetical protein WDW38_010077 [Sanguina aurantia]
MRTPARARARCSRRLAIACAMHDVDPVSIEAALLAQPGVAQAHATPPAPRAVLEARRDPDAHRRRLLPPQRRARCWRAALVSPPPRQAQLRLPGRRQALLGLSDVRVSDNFFDIGGHSLLAVDMAARIQRETGVQLNLLDIANGTLGTLAAELSGRSSQPPPAKRGWLGNLFGLR